MLAMTSASLPRFIGAAGIGITLLACCLTTASRADTYTFTPFSVPAPGIGHFNPQYGIYDLTGAPTGTVYNSFTATVDWSTFLGDYSEEALAGLYSNKPGSGTAYAPVYFADNGNSQMNDIQLHWGGNLATAYTGGNTLHFAYAQNFPNSEAYWQNVTITLNTAFIPVTPPPSTFISFSQLNTSYATTIYAQSPDWYSFRYVGGQLAINTLSDNGVPFDLVLYDSLGQIKNTSPLNLNATNLTVGELYYLALAPNDGFNFYNSDYRIIDNSSYEEDYQITFTLSGVTIPEIGTANLLLIGALPILAGFVKVRQRHKKA